MTGNVPLWGGAILLALVYSRLVVTFRLKNGFPELTVDASRGEK